MKGRRAALVLGAICLVLGAALLIWRVFEKYAPPPQEQTARLEATPVIPSLLQRTKSIELGQFVLMLMPSKGDSGEGAVDWSYRADSPIVWITNGVEDNSSGDRLSFIREGWIRVNVQGATPPCSNRSRSSLVGLSNTSPISHPSS